MVLQHGGLAKLLEIVELPASLPPSPPLSSASSSSPYSSFSPFAVRIPWAVCTPLATLPKSIHALNSQLQETAGGRGDGQPLASFSFSSSLLSSSSSRHAASPFCSSSSSSSSSQPLTLAEVAREVLHLASRWPYTDSRYAEEDDGLDFGEDKRGVGQRPHPCHHQLLGRNACKSDPSDMAQRVSRPGKQVEEGGASLLLSSPQKDPLLPSHHPSSLPGVHTPATTTPTTTTTSAPPPFPHPPLSSPPLSAGVPRPPTVARAPGVDRAGGSREERQRKREFRGDRKVGLNDIEMMEECLEIIDGSWRRGSWCGVVQDGGKIVRAATVRALETVRDELLDLFMIQLVQAMRSVNLHRKDESRELLSFSFCLC